MTTHTPVAVLGLGAMGTALADAVLTAGHPLTVWNRTQQRSTGLAEKGATAAPTAQEAVRSADLIIVCLFDHASVHQVLDPITESLRGRTVVNVTNTSPEQARELASWADEQGIDYLDGGLMAVPSMIGQPGAAILYSGSQQAFSTAEPVLSLWGESTYFGSDAGLASLYDLAMLAGMYVMFAGFFHGAAMVGSAGVTAREFASLSVPFLTAMVAELPGLASDVDDGDYTVPGQQSLEFSDQRTILAASLEAGVATDAVQMVQNLIQRQRDAGYSEHGFARIYESIARPDTSLAASPGDSPSASPAA